MGSDWKRTARSLMELAQRGGTPEEAANAAMALVKLCAVSGVLAEAVPKVKKKACKLCNFYAGEAPGEMVHAGVVVAAAWSEAGWAKAKDFHAKICAGEYTVDFSQDRSGVMKKNLGYVPPMPKARRIEGFVPPEPPAPIRPPLVLVTGCARCGEPTGSTDPKPGEMCRPCAKEAAKKVVVATVVEPAAGPEMVVEIERLPVAEEPIVVAVDELAARRAARHEAAVKAAATKRAKKLAAGGAP